MEVLKELFRSKKFLASLTGIILIVTNKIGFDLDQETVTLIVGLIAAYVVGQGVADLGKEKLKEEKKNDSNS